MIKLFIRPLFRKPRIKWSNFNPSDSTKQLAKQDTKLVVCQAPFEICSSPSWLNEIEEAQVMDE